MPERMAQGDRRIAGAAPNRASLPLSVRDLSLEVDGHRLLDAITITVASTGVTLVMGANGAGKSLLIRILHGLQAATAGEVSWNATPAGPATRRRQAMVFQRPVLLRRSAVANIDFVLRLAQVRSRDACLALLARVGLEQLADRPARQLSGGEQQRLALARALATGPEVLFLDEPTANLDPASTKIIEDIVREESRQGTKIIFVTHDIAQARRIGDEVIFMHHGRVLETAPSTRFFDNPTSPQARDYLAGRIVL